MRATKSAVRLKNSWMEMPVTCFETMTFGELKVGQKFIWLPEPGDNSGHGGLRGKHYIFTKTHMRVTEAAPGLPYGILTGRAIRNRTKTISDLPYSVKVLLVG